MKENAQPWPQPTLYGARVTSYNPLRLVQAIAVRSVSPRRDPSWHSSDSRVFRQKITAIQAIEDPPSPDAPTPWYNGDLSLRSKRGGGIGSRVIPG